MSVIAARIVALTLSLLFCCSCADPTRVRLDASAYCDTLDVLFENYTSAIGDAQWRYMRTGQRGALDTLWTLAQDSLASDATLERLDGFREQIKDSSVAFRLRRYRELALSIRVSSDPAIAAICDTAMRALLISGGIRATTTEEDLHEWLVRQARLRNQKVNTLGYSDGVDFALAMADLNRETVTSLLQQLEIATAASYRSALDTMRAYARTANVEAWRSDCGVKAHLPLRHGATSRQVAEELLLGVGFRIADLPIYCEAELLTPLVCGGMVLTPHLPEDTRVVLVGGNDPASVAEVSQMLRSLGSAVHASQIGKRKYGYRIDPSDFWRRTSGELFAETLQQRAWQRGALDSAREGASSLGSVMTAQSVIELRRQLVMANVEIELYSNPNGDLFESYHKHSMRLLGMAPPPNSREWLYDTDWFSFPGWQILRLVSQCVVAQTYYTVGRDFSTITGNKVFGEFLRSRYFEPGSSRPWSDLLFAATGEKLNTTYLLEKFQPVTP